MNRIQHLVVTVGTSLTTGLARVPVAGAGDFRAWLATQPGEDRTVLQEGRLALERARRAMEAGRWEDAGQALAELGDTPRILGAEISSLAPLLVEPRFEELSSVQLLHSDTREGEGCARAVHAYLVARYGLGCRLHVVEELQHGMESRFRVAGLRNLVRILARIYRECGGGEMAIDATGGYKPQVALAVLFGQAFGVPVLYRFERFKESIEFPPLPVRFEDGLIEEHLPLFQWSLFGSAQLAEHLGGPIEERNEEFARLRALLEGPVGGSREEQLWEVSPLGWLLYERWLSERTPALEAVLPAASIQQEPRWGTHHRPAGVTELAERLMRQCPWIRRIDTRSSTGRSHAPDGVTFRALPGRGPVPSIECLYVRDNHPAVLHITTTARSSAEQTAALRALVAAFAR